MAPVQLALHTQSLEDVMLELERCENPLAGHAFSLAKDGALHLLKEETLKTLRTKNVSVFSANIWDSPILSNQADMSLTALPTPQRLQNIMMKDIGSDNYFSFGPLRATPELNVHAILKLPQKITNPFYNERGAIIHMPSPTLDRLRTR